MPNNYGAIELGICENTSLALNDALGVSTGFKPSEWAENISGLVAPTVHLAEGAVASFPNGLAVPFVSVIADINAVQSGSGTPSPSNVRPISGVNAVNISVSGADTTIHDDTNIPLNQTVYGGRLNATTGELTITHAIIDMGSLAWVYNSSANVFWAVISDMQRPCTLLCEAYIQSSATNVESMADNEIWNRGYAYNDKNIVAKNTNYSTASDFKTSVTGVHLVYELATPTTVQLTPTQIEGLLGTNNVWADTGDIEVVYKGKSVRSDISFTSAVTSGWTATNGERDMLTITAITDAVITFNQTATGITNCSNSHGYEKITVNGVEKWRRTMPPNTSQTFNDIPVINLNRGDVMALTFGFTNSHSNINMNFVDGKIDIVGGVSFRGITGVTNTSTTII